MPDHPKPLKITVDINGVTCTGTLHPRRGGSVNVQELEKTVVAVARMAAQMIAKDMAEGGNGKDGSSLQPSN